MSVHAQGLALKADRQMIKNYEETGLYESNIERKSREEKQLKRTKRLESIKKHYVSLLGDSIIDNKVYVGEGELSVTEHLQHKSSSNFSMMNSFSSAARPFARRKHQIAGSTPAIYPSARILTTQMIKEITG